MTGVWAPFRENGNKHEGDGAAPTLGVAHGQLVLRLQIYIELSSKKRCFPELLFGRVLI